MKNHLRFYFVGLLIFALSLSCNNDDDSSEDECTKIITIPQLYFSGGQFYSYDIEQEVSCDFPEPEDVAIVEPPELENFNYEILVLNFSTDTANNTRNIEVEIEINNSNPFDVEGIVIATLDIGSNTTTTGPFFQDIASNPCTMISANSSCIFQVNVQESLNIIPPDYSFEIIDIKYYLTSN